MKRTFRRAACCGDDCSRRQGEYRDCQKAKGGIKMCVNSTRLFLLSGLKTTRSAELERTQRTKRAAGRKVALLSIIVATAAADPPFAKAADAPFGFAWFQEREALPRPSSELSDANITELTYERSRLPPPMTDTEIVALKVCKKYGLQQVRWVSRIFDRIAAINKFLVLLREGTNRYGAADEGNPSNGTAGWSGEGIGLAIDHADQDNYRVLMISDGPQFERCQAEYRQITGHQ
jgi:hypothetical protein